MGKTIHWDLGFEPYAALIRWRCHCLHGGCNNGGEIDGLPTENQPRRAQPSQCPFGRRTEAMSTILPLGSTFRTRGTHAWRSSSAVCRYSRT